MTGPDPAGTEPPRLARRVAISSIYAILQRGLMRGLGLVSTLILVRLLSAEDFGIVALSAILIDMLETLTATGFVLALVRMRAPTQAHYDTVFSLTVARGLLVAGALVALADVQADFVGDPRIAPVIRLIAVTAVLESLLSPRMVDLQREFRFDRLLRYHVFQKVLVLAISLPLAFWLRSYWALVLGAPLSRIVMIPLSYRMAPYRPRFSMAAWRDLFDFSKWLMLGNVFVMIYGQLFSLAVGRLFGVAAVGQYSVAYQIAALPVTEIAAPIRAPFYAGLSRVHESLADLRRLFLGTFGLQWIVILPLSAGVALCANEVTLLFLGEKWASLVPLIAIVAMFGLIDDLGHFTVNVFIVLNRQKLLVATHVAGVVLQLAFVVGGALHGGLVGAAWGLLATGIGLAAIRLLLLARIIGLPASQLLGVLWRGAAAALSMAAAVLAVPSDIGAQLGAAAWPVATALIAKVLVGGLVYPAVLLGLWRAVGAPGTAAEAVVLRALSAALGRTGGMLQRLAQRSAAGQDRAG